MRREYLSLLIFVVVVLGAAAFALTGYWSGRPTAQRESSPIPTVEPAASAVPQDWLTLDSRDFGYRFQYPPNMHVSYETLLGVTPENAGDLLLTSVEPSGTVVTFDVDIGTSIAVARASGITGIDADVLRQYAAREWERNRDVYADSDLRSLNLGGVPAFAYDLNGGHFDLIEFGDGTNWTEGPAYDPNRRRLLTLCRRGSDGLLYIIRLLFTRDNADTRTMADTFRCPLVFAAAAASTSTPRP